MIKIAFPDLDLSMSDTNEILGMGGPHIGTIWLGNKIVAKECVVHNFVYSKELNVLLFVKHHRINNYVYFIINFYDLGGGSLYQFTNEFNMVFIKRFVDKSKIEIFQSFNDKVSQGIIFDLDQEDFIEV